MKVSVRPTGRDRSGVVGLDIGTTSAKAVLLSAEGNELCCARTRVSVDHRGYDLVEQDMEEVRTAACQALRSVITEDPDVEVVAVGVTGQGDGAWLVDAEGRPVRPAVIWLDGRASHRVKLWVEDGRAEILERVTGSSLYASALPVLLDELEHNEPASLARARWHLNCKDWVRFRLTGVVGTDRSDASRTYLDPVRGEYSRELFGRLGHERFRRLLPPIMEPCDAVPIRSELSRELSLAPGTLVVTGMVDVVAAGVGLGAIHPGDSYAVLGTTAFVGVVDGDGCGPRGHSGLTLATGVGRSLVKALAPMAGTPNLDWICEVTGQGYQNWADVEAEASSSGPGGVVYLPYGALSGERAPFVDAAASAALLGLSVTTTRAQLLSAVYHGIAMSLRECTEVLGIDRPLSIAGGGATSKLLCQAIADATGRPTTRLPGVEVGARGAGAIALVGAGLAEDVDAAVSKLADHVETHEPDLARRSYYDDQFAAFRAARDAIRPVWPVLRNLKNGPSPAR